MSAAMQHGQSTQTPILLCNCAEVPPTMPTCRDKHLPSCPASVLDFLCKQATEADEWAAQVQVQERRSLHDHAAPMRSWIQGYAYAMSLAARWIVTREEAKP